MKQIFTLVLSTLIFSSTFAQKTLDKTPGLDDVFTVRQVAYMVVYPGCEKYDVNNKQLMQKCFQQNLTNELSKKLRSFASKLEKQGLNIAVAKVQFVVDTKGKLIQIQAFGGGNPQLAEAAEKALKKIAKQIKPIQPAYLENGDPVNIVFQLPIKFQLESDNSVPTFEWNEIVIGSLLGDKENYEIRSVKESPGLFKVYAVKNGAFTFLGKYESLETISATEPYKSLIPKMGGRNLLVEGEVNGELYRVYYGSADYSVYEIYKVTNGEESLVKKLKNDQFLANTDYLMLVLR